MPYKSKRTRDLQGEVVAGSGLSVTEQIKPDGTKEYTITNGDPASAITVSGEGLSLIANVLRNTMAEELGFHAQTDNQTTSINWYDDNSDPVLIIQELERLFIGDVKDNAGFFLKQESPTDNKLISGDIQIAKDLIAASGVSLQTLAENINSFSLIEFGVASYKSGNKSYIYGGDLTFIQGTNFYEKTGIYVNELSDTLYGIKITKTGYYKLLFNFNCGNIDTIGTINDYNLHLSICDISEGAILAEDEVNTEAYVNNNGTWFNFTHETFIYLEMNKVISFEIDIEDANVADIHPGSLDPRLSIQKVR